MSLLPVTGELSSGEAARLKGGGAAMPSHPLRLATLATSPLGEGRS